MELPALPEAAPVGELLADLVEHDLPLRQVALQAPHLAGVAQEAERISIARCDGEPALNGNIWTSPR